MILVGWPALSIACRMEPAHTNQALYEWFSSGLPYQSIQGHAVVSGDLLYTKNIPVPYSTYDYNQLASELLTEAPVGRVFINVSRGQVGTIMIKYTDNITEDMPYPIIGQIHPDDLSQIQVVGEAVWQGYYQTKDYYLCEFKQGAA